jgi:hypothetical protein
MMPREKTIFDPSGDHAGFASVVAFIVSRCSFDPLALITQISPPLTKASFKPSGDHTGPVGAGCVIAVN